MSFGEELQKLQFSAAHISAALLKRCGGDKEAAVRMFETAASLKPAAFDLLIQQAASSREAGRDCTVVHIAAALVEAVRLIELAAAIKEREILEVLN